MANRHHDLHHRVPGVNVNRAFPLADWLPDTAIQPDVRIPIERHDQELIYA